MRPIPILWACFGLAVSAQAVAQRPAARIPSDPNEVLERLPAGFSAATARRPGDRVPASQILSILALAASTGDTRLSGRAQRLLDAHPRETSDAGLLRARAFAAQHRHDFAAALAELDRLLRMDPRSGDALLTRAQIHLVQGRLDRARADCARLSLHVDAGLGTLCTAALSLRLGRWKTAAVLTDRWLSAAEDDVSLRLYALLLRAEAASRAREADADRWFRQALALGPGDVRTLAAFSRHLRRTARDARVVALLRTAPPTDALLLEQALASARIGEPRAAALRSELGRRFELARAAGQPIELRDQAEYELSLRRDPVRALDLALRNFEEQRDAEDVDLLMRAAAAARRPRALDGLRSWAASHRVPLAPAESR